MRCGRRTRGRFAAAGLMVGALMLPAPDAAAQEARRDSLTARTAKVRSPLSLLAQVQLANYHAPSVIGAEGSFNQLGLEPVVPLRRFGSFPLAQIIRLDAALITTPEPDRVTGLSDIQLQDLFVPDLWARLKWGVGFVLVMPTATDDRTGLGKWMLGPAAGLVYELSQHIQIGGLVQNPISFAGDPDRSSVSYFLFEPLFSLMLGRWYVGSASFDWTYDWKQNAWTIPLGVQVGRVTRIGKLDYDLSIAFQRTVVHEVEPVPEWGFQFQVTLLLPE